MPIPLEQPRFSLSDDQRSLIIELVEAAGPEVEDPASWTPEFKRTIEVPLPRNPKRDPA